MSLNGIWAIDPNKLWSVGDSGTILKWDKLDPMWKNQSSGTGIGLYALWGNSAETPWAFGSVGTILHKAN